MMSNLEDAPPAPKASSSDKMNKKVKGLLKDTLEKVDTMCNFLVANQPVGGLPHVSRQSSISDIEMYLTLFKSALDKERNQKKWLESIYGVLRSGLLDQESSGPIIESSPLAGILVESISSDISNIDDQCNTISNILKMRNCLPPVPNSNFSEQGKQTEMNRLTQENNNLTEIAAILTRKLSEFENQKLNNINEIAKEHECQRAQWKKSQLEMKETIEELQRKQRDLQETIDYFEKANRQAVESPRESLEDTSKSAMRLLMRQLAQSESKVDRLQKSETELMDKLHGVEASRDHVVHTIVDGATFDSDDEFIKLQAKHQYMKAVVKQFIRYQQEGDHEKSMMVLPAIRAVLDLPIDDQ
eukprot:GHVH01004254.1.p1 GENE.GHVH01004254.1~~GHVH01004254.1.p1  ORF type:complete len:358 (+),score=65.18 GHVH01004254.1:27-1100(+)